MRVQTEWISIFFEQPNIGDVVFVSNGDRRDSRFPVAAKYRGSHFVGVGNRDLEKIYDDVLFWFSADSLPAVPVLPGCYLLENLDETVSFLLSVSRTELGLSDHWVSYRHNLAKEFFTWEPGETNLEFEPVALVAELNVWSRSFSFENCKPASLDFYVRAREPSGDIVFVGRGEWSNESIPNRSEIERRKLELPTSV